MRPSVAAVGLLLATLVWRGRLPSLAGISGQAWWAAAGLTYRRSRRWHVTLRIGPPLFPAARPDRCRLLHTVEEQTHLLSETLQSEGSP